LLIQIVLDLPAGFKHLPQLACLLLPLPGWPLLSNQAQSRGAEGMGMKERAQGEGRELPPAV